MYPLFVTEEEVIDQVEVAERLWEEALEARMDANALADQAQEMSEFAQCTFQPKIHDAPGYVKRIAHSMKLTRAAQRRVEGSGKGKQEWR